MNALSKLFETLHLSRRETVSRRSHRRRRTRQQRSFLSCETLEPKQLLAADVAVQFSDLVLDTTGPTTVAIEGKFEDNEVSGAVVKFETNAPLDDPDFYVELTSDESTPLTNANFLSYVNSGAYDNSIFHRSVLSFVIQGGGYKAPIEAANHPDLTLSEPVAIANTGTIQNEPGNPNTRGTIAMAKPNADPDGARSQFFFNLGDNNLDQSGNPGGFLDSINGGYTQFGSVLGSGMTVVDSMNQTLTFQADSYYGNTDFEEGLPLYNWGVDEEGEVFREGVDNFIIRPEDFVKIENVDVVAESDLFTYTVSSSDEAKLTASVDGNGNLALTPDSSAYGSVDVTITATSKLDNSTASDTFSVQLGPALTAIEEAGNTVLNKDADGKLYAGDQPLYMSGSTQLTETYFAAYTPVAVEDFGDGDKRFVLKHSTGSLLTFSMSATWTRTGNLPWIETNDPTAFNAAELEYGIDFNNDGVTGRILTALESTGTLLNKDQDGKLYAGDQPLYMSGSTQLTETYFAAYTPVAVEDFGDGDKRFVLKHSTGSLLTFSMSATWTRTGNLPWIETNDPTAFNTAELEYGIDFNNDGVTGRILTALESTGTLLNKDQDGKLYAGDQPLYMSGSTQLTETYFAAYTPVAVEDFGDGDKRFVLKHSTGSLLTFSMSATWTRTGNLPWIETNDPTAFNTAEADYGVDFDSDGDVSLIELETNGLELKKDLSGKLYAGDQPLYMSGTTQLTETYFAAYTPVAVEDFGDGDKRFVLKHSTGSLLTFSMSATWTRTGNLPWIETNDPTAFNAAELEYGVDFDDDGNTGLIFTPIETAGSTALRRDQSGRLYAGSQPIYLSGTTQLTETYFAAYTPVAVEDFGDGDKRFVLKHSTGSLLTFSMSATWTRTGNLPWIEVDDSVAFNAAEAEYGLDFDGDA